MGTNDAFRDQPVGRPRPASSPYSPVEDVHIVDEED